MLLLLLFFLTFLIGYGESVDNKLYIYQDNGELVLHVAQTSNNQIAPIGIFPVATTVGSTGLYIEENAEYDNIDGPGCMFLLYGRLYWDMRYIHGSSKGIDNECHFISNVSSHNQHTTPVRIQIPITVENNENIDTGDDLISVFSQYTVVIPKSEWEKLMKSLSDTPLSLIHI